MSDYPVSYYPVGPVSMPSLHCTSWRNNATRCTRNIHRVDFHLNERLTCYLPIPQSITLQTPPNMTFKVCHNYAMLWGLPFMTSSKFSVFFTPPLLVCKFTQPPLLRSLTMSAFEGTPPSADVINRSPFHQIFPAKLLNFQPLLLPSRLAAVRQP